MNVAVRELKDHLSEYLNRASAGEELVVTSHGKPIARLAPLMADNSEEAAIDRLRVLPWIRPGKGGKLRPAANQEAWEPGSVMLSDLVLDDRE